MAEIDWSQWPWSQPGHQYALDVVSGAVPAFETTILCAQRYLDDLQGLPGFELLPELADPVIQAAGLFRHTKGPMTGKPLVLEPWQAFVVLNLFGWVNGAGHRRFLQAFIFVPRGNGKTAFAAFLGVLMTFMLGEGGAEGYSAAVTRDQARILFKMSQLMCKKAPAALRDEYGIVPRTHDILSSVDGSVFKPLAADADSLDGLSVQFACCDEIASHKTGDVYGALLTGCGKRDEPLLMSITTATDNISGIGNQLYRDSKRIVTRETTDESWFALLYEAPEKLPENEYWSEDVWRKVNPNWGVSVNARAITAIAKQAQNNPAHAAFFRTRHLNQWVGTNAALLHVAKWQQCAADIRPEEFAGLPAWIGVDMSSKVDLAAVCAVVDSPEGLAVFVRLYLPDETVRAGKVKAYETWAGQGDLILHPGETIDQNAIKADLETWIELFDVQAVGFDPWETRQLMSDLERDWPEVTQVALRQSTANLSEPTKEVDALIRKLELRHEGNPVMAWCIGNVVGHEDANGNVHPRKPRPENKIDGAIALIIATALRLFEDEDEAPGIGVIEQ